jgi:hypothetical protein
MASTAKEKHKLLARARRIRGQVEGLERGLEAEKGCAEVMQQIAAVRGAINGQGLLCGGRSPMPVVLVTGSCGIPQARIQEVQRAMTEQHSGESSQGGK